MISNLDRYRKDLDSLIAKGSTLYTAMQYECFPSEFKKALKQKDFGEEKGKAVIKNLPSVRETYQSWYSEAKILIRQLLPDRLEDFVRHYEKPKSRKEITIGGYTIEDYLQGLAVTRGQGQWKVKLVGPDAALAQLRQQLAIVESVRARFESSLFDIQQLVQADLFDSELDSAEELLKQKFMRAAGAVAGVVLERHLLQVCGNHKIKIAKKSPTISDLNDALKGTSAIDVPQWRFIQHLADLRNLCDHNKAAEPTSEQVGDMLAGVRKITKTLF